MEQQQIIILAAIFILVIVGLLIFLLFRQQRQISNLQKPKYGFLGKPLSAAIVTIIMGASIIGGVFYLNNQDQELSYEASADEVQIEVIKKCIQNTGSVYQYKLQVLPKVEGEVPAGSVFDAYWTIDPNTANTQSLSEVNLAKNNPSEITVNIRQGTHPFIVFVRMSIDGEPKTNLTPYNGILNVEADC